MNKENTCPNCGNSVNSEAIFCNQCGKKLVNGDNVAAGNEISQSSKDSLQKKENLKEKYYIKVFGLAALVLSIIIIVSIIARVSSRTSGNENKSLNEDKQTITSQTNLEVKDLNNISDLNKGDIVAFGTYEQDNNLSNGSEKIEWQVLDLVENKALIISKYVLDYQKYNDYYEDTTWQLCSLRKWLNDSFLNEAFNKDELLRVKKTMVPANYNPNYNTKPGWETNDSVFLLSVTETRELFENDELKKCTPTAYAISKGIQSSKENLIDGKDNCWWWLRSPGGNPAGAALICGDGSEFNAPVDKNNGIRPALWVDCSLSSSNIDSNSNPLVSNDELKKKLSLLNVGDTFTFGMYEQDGSIVNGMEDIKWRILSKNRNEMLVISDAVLDFKIYDDYSNDTITWELSSIRQWLNSDFINTAFNEEEKSVIQNAKVENNTNDDYGTDAGNDTSDKVFLLSLEEAKECFDDNEARYCLPTTYAIEQYQSDYGFKYPSLSSQWWLRSPGNAECNRALIDIDGSVDSEGLFTINGLGIRPAMWLSIENNTYQQKKEEIDNSFLPSNRVTLSAGSEHSLGLRSNGTVVATGNNEYGSCNVSEWKDIVSVSAGHDYSLGLHEDGTVDATIFNGSAYSGKCDVSEWSDIVAVSAGWDHSLGLKSDGTVVSTDYYLELYHGQCDVNGWRDIIAISAGGFHSLGLKSDGTVVAVGENDDGQCDVTEWRNIVAISAGAYHSLGLKSDGTVFAKGSNFFGNCCDVSDWENLVAISAGYNHSLGLHKDGTVVAVGDNECGQCNVSNWTDIVAISAGSYCSLGLKSDGTVIAAGNIYFGEGDVSGWTNIGLPELGGDQDHSYFDNKNESVSYDTYNGYDIALYEEDRTGTVTNTGSYGLMFRSTPERLEDKSNRISNIKDGTIIPVLGYYVHDSKWIYTKYNGAYGFVCSQNNGETYLSQ